MTKDYYFILGVNADATQEQIKSAYRREAKRCHPDVSGAGSEPFLAVQEAYEVLGDRRRREVYDEELAREKTQPYRAREIRPEPLRRRGCPVEPLIPSRRSNATRDPFFEPPFQSFFDEPSSSPWSETADRFTPERRRGTETVDVQVSLSREEALHGGRLRIWIPAQIRCPACGGRGGIGFFACPDCSGRGVVAREYPVDVTFPGGIADGDSGSVSLSPAGLRHVTLTLHFGVHER